MLRISKLTDYGIVVATHLAGLGQEPVAVPDLARATGIPQPTVGKVLKQLARAGVVVSQRGAHGGYRLSRDPSAIHVADVIEALEGPIAVTECSTEETAGACDREGVCGVQANWQRINAAVQKALEGISLADMAQSSAPTLVQLGRPPRDGDVHERST